MATTTHDMASTRIKTGAPVRVRALNRPKNRVERKRDSGSRSWRSEVGLALALFVVIASLLVGFAAIVTWGVSLAGSLLGSLAGV